MVFQSRKMAIIRMVHNDGSAIHVDDRSGGKHSKPNDYERVSGLRDGLWKAIQYGRLPCTAATAETSSTGLSITGWLNLQYKKMNVWRGLST